MKRYVKKHAFGDHSGVFDIDERVSAGLGTQLVKRDHGDQSGVSDISISTPPEVAARKLSKLEAPDMEKYELLIRAGFQEDATSHIMHLVHEMERKGAPNSGD